MEILIVEIRNGVFCLLIPFAQCSSSVPESATGRDEVQFH
jgi:hypothetical protein